MRGIVLVLLLLPDRDGSDFILPPTTSDITNLQDECARLVRGLTLALSHQAGFLVEGFPIEA